MSIGTRREIRQQGADVWPGFVDALSTLLLVTIFLLTVFVLGQFFLQQVVEGQDEALGELEQEVSSLSQALGLEEESNEELRDSLARLNSVLEATLGERDDLASELTDVQAVYLAAEDRIQVLESQQRQLESVIETLRSERDQAVAARDEVQAELEALNQTVSADKETIEAQLAELVTLRRDIATLREVRNRLETEVAAAIGNNEALRDQLAQARDRSLALEAELADAQDTTLLAQRELQETEVRLEDVLRASSEQELEVIEKQRQLIEARNQMALLNVQIEELRNQLASIQDALDLEQERVSAQNEIIADLGSQLNLALADKVQELQQVRSEFFARLTEVIGDRETIRVEGDRFVFQAEVLFASGSAVIEPGGTQQLRELAATLREILPEIPSDLPWILRIDGHSDRRPVTSGRFANNWELSAARAISVVQFLIGQGIPANRLAATGFGEYQPIDNGLTDEAFRRNRRIEIKLTTR
ncbi:MAG: peptidoglycan -binding protein [Geminicoccaceae bacterium]